VADPETALMTMTLGPDLYAGWRGTELGTITEALEDRLLYELIGEVAGRQILDVGCGEGALAISLQQRGGIVTGVDPSWEMVAAARKHAQTGNAPIGLVVARGEQLPFASDRFDLVLAKTVLCFVDEAQAMLDEMARVLRPGGRLVIGELHKWSSWAAMRRLRAWLGSRLWQRGRFRTARELKDMAQMAGLEVEVVRGAVYYPRLTLAARLLAPHDAYLARLTNIGAAFIAMAAVKPTNES
jgi:ubiquinone biosynthesis O-methyltransferase